MPKTITPAEAFDATNEKMVRVPVQFPASPRIVVATVANDADTTVYGQIKGNVITFAAPLTTDNTLNLSVDNFHATSNLCIVRVSATAIATLSFALPDAAQSDATLAAGDDLTITLYLCEQLDGNCKPIIISSVNNN